MRRAPRFIILTLGYTALLHLAYVAALLLRFEGEVPGRFWDAYRQIAPAWTLLGLAGFFAAGLYHGLWRYASTVTLFQVFKGATLASLALVAILFFSPEPPFPRSVVFVVWMALIVTLGGARFAWRLSRERVLGPVPSRALRTIVVGADHTGVHLVQEMRRGEGDSTEALNPIGFIDADQRLAGHLVEGVRVWGTIADLPRVLDEQRVEMVIISDADMPAKVVREIARFCGEASVRVQTMPGLSDLQHGRPALSQMRDVRIEDLLGRQPVHLDLGEIAGFLRDRRVLVTGAGGSIGSELARQVSGFAPEEIVLLDHAENGLYFVHNELAALHPEIPIHAVVADVQDRQGMDMLFERFRPGVVFHAAAHKHVPLLEASPREAVLNNILGTRNVVDCSERHGVSKFVLISTDKAVNPTSVMGASKRVCEMIVQARGGGGPTAFVAVRFGNVLGSDGSVIPLFQRQIQRGGPITVTHPEARRYFMTIPEAVRLVLQAGAMGRGGEVYLLDMGEQVRIVDLARQLVRMQGLREGDDVEIVFTGLRPGEKLFEELHSDAERTRITRHERILVWELDPVVDDDLRRELVSLTSAAEAGDPAAIRRGLHRLVPEYVETANAPAPEGESVPEPAAVIQLPVGPGRRARRPREEGWGARLRAVADSGLAALLLVAALPIWLALWVEAGRRGASPVYEEVRVGRSRRAAQRRQRRAEPPIDRRSIERRTQDLLGTPIVCARFRTDLGPIGRWAGRRRLDKLPFLFNVLRGEMAFVGPKPEKVDLVLRWKGLVPDYERRFLVLPGITGLAQVSGCPDDTLEGVHRRVRYDLEYVDGHSWSMDLRLLARTFVVVMSRPRSSGGRRVPARPADEPRETPVKEAMR